MRKSNKASSDAVKHTLRNRHQKMRKHTKKHPHDLQTVHRADQLARDYKI